MKTTADRKAGTFAGDGRYGAICPALAGALTQRLNNAEYRPGYGHAKTYLERCGRNKAAINA
jgi:hypothetical protein